jgi:hypothetical protein
LRTAHVRQTLPWSDEGWRLLPTANYLQYAEHIRRAKAEWDTAVAAFVAAYPRLCRVAETRLGNMYRRDDYPPAEAVAQKFAVDIRYSPLPVGRDLRLRLPEAELQHVRQEMESRLAEEIREAVKYAWEALASGIEKLKKHVDPEKRGEKLLQNAIDDLRELAETLGRLNLTHDAELERTRQRVLKELARHDAATLRGSKEKAAAAAAAAEEILQKVRAAYGGGQ